MRAVSKNLLAQERGDGSAQAQNTGRIEARTWRYLNSVRGRRKKEFGCLRVTDPDMG